MSAENKLGLNSSTDLAREEERISKEKALALFKTGIASPLFFENRYEKGRPLVKVKRP